MNEDRTPILIGAGQYTQRDADPTAAKEPLELMVETARRAAEDAGADARLLRQLDCVAVVNVLAWRHGNAPRALAERLGAVPQQQVYTTVGGNTPQWLVNETAAQIAAGRVRLALLAGAEAMHTLWRARRAGIELKWSTGGADAPTIVGDARMGANEHEMNHGLQMPTQIYPLFENALRAHYGLSLAAHRERLGVLCSRLSAVAAQNPYAWFRQARTPAEIATVTTDNRLIGFPYPKYMNAIIDVDQSAAVLMTSVGAARNLGIDPSRWVYLVGCGDARDLWFVTERVNYYSSPAIRLAGEQALGMAGLDIAQVDHFDLYSCFPCAVQIARDMLGIAKDDPRPLTVTGGLPYHGGPGNNYTMHGIAATMEKLRAARGTKGLVNGLGWYMTRHSIGIYGTDPNPGPWRRPDPETYQADIDRAPRPELAIEPSGKATVETYTVLHDRDGQPTKGIVIGRLQDARRFVANTPGDRVVLEALMAREAVGTTGNASSSGGLNRFEPD
jgi:acetyl-CoA C-acetyltransferase